MERLRRLSKSFLEWVRPGQREGHSPLAERRGSQSHVIVLDGTMSTLEPGDETNAGLTYKLLCEAQPALSLFYEAGLQWYAWRNTHHVMMGRGINQQIRRAYGFLASRYRPGDRIFLVGYSRGAYAVRSLAGVIDSVGLLRPECATERNIRQTYRLYSAPESAQSARAFAAHHCHADVPIEAVAVWDTVKALGLRLPFVWERSERKHAYHNHHLGPSIKHGFHALALDETREVFDPVLWECPPDFEGDVRQVWFTGTHGDIGGHLGGYMPARPLANIPLVWMLERLAECGLVLPEDWRERFPTDPDAPSVGTWRGWGKMFLLRKARVVGRDKSERLHETVQGHEAAREALGVAV
ncbi:MAG: DUF2235 domain-containing protein [Sediminimonas sp.]|uniref:DUF2235 domain-containing protein n=1 Tax=Sediminimonas sp. TaxID=2823379 RepID=UPI0028700CAF|nr:DUF2235 domain-containing protein [Sediminimonas sp.]MDR9484887.1 DUF2235 domain-containing protein [Sediminimonas sp.]